MEINDEGGAEAGKSDCGSIVGGGAEAPDPRETSRAGGLYCSELWAISTVRGSPPKALPQKRTGGKSEQRGSLL